MNARELLTFLRERDVALWADRGELRYDAPRGALLPEMRDGIRAHRNEILGILEEATRRVRPSDRVIPRVSRGGDLCLSFSQERLWFLDRLFPGSVAYNCQRALRLNGPLDTTALERSLGEIVRRQEVLRTTFRASPDGRPVPVVHPPWPFVVRLVDLSGPGDREGEAERLLREEVERPFRLDRDRLIRGLLLRLAEEEHLLVLTLHHIVTDGPSMGVILSELGAFYEAFIGGRGASLPEPPIQYLDFASWQRRTVDGETLEGHLSYWKRELDGIPELLELPTDRPRPAVPSGSGARQSFRVSARLNGALRELARSEGATPFMVFLAAFQTLLFRYTGQSDVVVGSPLTWRTRHELEDLVGFFVRTLVIRGRLSGNSTFRELLERVRSAALGAWAHADVPFHELVRALRPERSLDHTPLFVTSFSLQEADPELRLSGVEVSPLAVPRTTTIFDLDLSLTESGKGLSGQIVYATDLFDAATIARMAGHYRTLLAGIVSTPDERIDRLPILSEAERYEALVTWNDTAAAYPHDRCIHDLVASQAASTPEAIAVRQGERTITYGELDRRADALACRLRRRGVGPEIVVAVSIERSIELVVGLLAVLKAGGAYLPLDPAHPSERRAALIHDARARIVLAERSLPPLGEGALLFVDEDGESAGPDEAAGMPRGLTPASLAYVICTSGSTGGPKGVEITHRGMVNFAAWAASEFELRPGDRVLQFASIAFDTAVEEIFPCLLRGATLVLRDGRMLDSVPALLDGCRRWGVTVLDLPTTYWHELAAELAAGRGTLPEPIRLVIIGGEAARNDRLRQWRRAVGPRVRLLNTYGPTETTVVATACDLSGLDPEPHRNVPIGRPIANAQAYVLGPGREPVPVGVVGELCVGGVGLARGYRNDPDLTRERFIDHPFVEGSRLYRTGDRVRRLPTGDLEFLGREDRQVKILGFRVDLGEVETALRRHPAVEDTVVVSAAGKDREAGLVAYVVGSGDGFEIDALRDFLEQSLPGHMIPAAFVRLPALPLTSTGKVDRVALPAPERSRAQSTERVFVAARDPFEHRLAGIWERLLDVRPIGVRDDFFDLGGHSLLALRLFAEIERTTGIRLPLASLFGAATIEDQARLLREEPAPKRWSPIVPIQPGGSKPPFFCVHAHEGNVLFYRDLAGRLGPDQPFFAFQARGLDGDEAPSERVEEMAGSYVEAVRTLQPEGPYFLGGYCFGGPVAFEMARQLESQGEAVAILVLFDAYAPGYSARRTGRLMRPLSRIGQKTALHGLNLLLLPGTRKVGYAVARLKKIVLRAYVRSRLPLSRRYREVREALRRAAGRYRPDGYAGRVVLFRASRLSAGYVHDPHLGWDTLVTGDLEVHEIPGYYGTIILEPRVAGLVGPLTECLSRAAGQGEGAPVAPLPGGDVAGSAPYLSFPHPSGLEVTR